MADKDQKKKKTPVKKSWSFVKKLFRSKPNPHPSPPPPNPPPHICLYADGDSVTRFDPLLWSLHSERHFRGRFSIATVTAHANCQDYSQVEVRPDLTFLGIYDGHQGDQVSRHVAGKIFEIFWRNFTADDVIESAGLENTIRHTEEEVRRFVDSNKAANPLLKATGTSCLVGVLSRDTLFIANVGDSRAVAGDFSDDNMSLEALTVDHNANVAEARDEIQGRHPHDGSIVTEESGTWRVKGIIQVTRSIGDMYMKFPGYELDPDIPEQRKFCIPGQYNQPILSSRPTITHQVIKDHRSFVVFATRGFWENITEQQVIAIVRRTKSRYRGVAEVLLRRAIAAAASRNAGTTYDSIKNATPEERRNIHGDITVIVLTLRPNMPDHATYLGSWSYRACNYPTEGEGYTAGGSNYASTSASGSNVASSSGTKDGEITTLADAMRLLGRRRIETDTESD